MSEFQPSNLELFSALQNVEAGQIGTTLSRAPTFVPFGNLDLNTQQAYSTLNAMTFETSVPSRSIEFQGTQNPINVLSGINLAGGSSNYAQGPIISRPKRKMIYQDDVLSSRIGNSFVQGDRGHSSSSSYTFDHRYTLYDKRYQAIGLPVDPHLRIFNATNGNGSGGST